jgi:hypothetical protein
MLFPSIETGTAMNARESENYRPISRSFSASEWKKIFTNPVKKNLLGKNIYQPSKKNFLLENHIYQPSRCTHLAFHI